MASGKSLSQRMLSIRDRAFAELGDRDLGDLEVDGGRRSSRGHGDRLHARRAANVARRVEGTVTVPCFLNTVGCPSGSRYSLGADGLPHAHSGQHLQARYICNIPRSASAAAPARPSLYGHGLFGDAGEVGADNVEQLGNENNVLVCAADWIGMADEDVVPNALEILTDLSRFPSLADRLQQGFLDFMFVGRDAWSTRPGFASNPAFREGRPPADRHAPALLLRQQPGRHRGRRAHRGCPGLQPLGPLRGRDELQPPARPQRGLRRRSRRC